MEVKGGKKKSKHYYGKIHTEKNYCQLINVAQKKGQKEWQTMTHLMVELWRIKAARPELADSNDQRDDSKRERDL